MNFIRKFIGTSATDEVASIPSGKLFLTRSPQSPKGEMECLYIDAFACIRQTTRPFFFQLCITRVYQEGELVAHGSSGFDDSDEDDEDDNDTPHSLSDATTGSKDEWTFSILEDLKIHSYTKTDGTRAIAWKDLNGDIGDKFEFIVDEDVKLNDVDAFMLALHKCLYEVKYHRSSLGIKDLSELDEFIFTPKPELISIGDLKSSSILQYDSDEEDDDEDEEDVEDDPEDDSDGDNDFKDASADSLSNFDTKIVEPKGITTYSNKEFELHFYDTSEGCFKLVGAGSETELKLINLGDWEYTLYVHTTKGAPVRFNATLSKNMNPTFNYEHLSFIFNYFAIEGTELLAYSWLLKFPTFNDLSAFQNAFMGALWETLNKQKWIKASEVEQEYVLDAFSKLDVNDPELLSKDDRRELEAEEEEEEEEKEEASHQAIEEEPLKEEKSTKKLFVDEDDDEYGDNEEEAKLNTFKSASEKNSNLSVGSTNNRSYVARGDKLGVFNSYNDGIAYQTTISNLKDLKGKKLNPEKMMLHQQDQFMVLSSKEEDKSLFKMDLNRGKIVEEWKVSEDIPVVSYGPNSKFAQLTNEQTLTGISNNGLFKIDPRLSGYKIVNNDAALKTNPGFQSLTTTDEGYIAVGSKKGDIRLYDRIGIRAKSALPSLGEPIIGLDVSKDGRWLLATCKTYLLLIDTKIGGDQKNSGALGFTKYFDKDKKPKPRRLTINPEHAAYISTTSGDKSLSFTHATFNAGVNSKETTIVTSTGPYIISWSLRKVLLGQPNPYSVRRYQQEVVADSFKFGSSSDVIIALQDDVSMVKKQRLAEPSKVLRNKSRNSVVKSYK
ncbi:VID27 cytoplasmic protein-domain-containing protein [Scheffersomyces xylosifermentans]|uniref:VID27 cytoplasmic protein-domain-containing protein n=1 Tax=Scheffersomyces xylosifermentans TaxID=1304137 RepID=UPI00315D7D6B